MTRVFQVFTATILGLALLACSGPSDLYLLPEQPVTTHLNTAARSVVVEIIDLPDYAKDSDVAIHGTDGILSTDKTGLWADSPERALTGLLASNLDYGLSAHVSAAPYPFQTSPDIQVEVKVAQLYGALEGTLVFSGQYFLTSPAGGSLERAGRFSYTVPVAGPSVSDLALAQSKAIAKLAADVAQRISKTSASQL